VRFESGRNWDIATGRAEKAYGGELSRAQRTIVYLRPGVVLVHDSLASDKPHAWEWNLHAMAKMGKLSDKVVQVRNGAGQDVRRDAGEPRGLVRADRPVHRCPEGQGHRAAMARHLRFHDRDRTARSSSR
jgi:hypothetical protein